MPKQRYGITLSAVNRFINLFENGIIAACPWYYQRLTNGEPWMIWRDILKLTDVYMKETGNNLISEGTSIYHNKHFKDGRDIHKITLLNQDIIDKYGLKIGD